MGDASNHDRTPSEVVRWYEAGLRAVDAEAAVRDRLSWDGRELAIAGDVIATAPESTVVAVAVGKAAAAMANGLAEVMGDRLSRGIILTKDGHAERTPAGWEVYEASHPVPDERGVRATRTILDAVAGLGPGDLVIVLVSGGGSALLEAPRPPLILDDIRETTRLLLNAGAPIQHLNAVRSELSLVKGGGLRRAIGRAACVSMILSDVLGNDPTVIASGPTIARIPDPDTALEILHSYHLLQAVPGPVVEVLEAPESGSNEGAGSPSLYAVIGDNDQFIEAVAAAARDCGRSPGIEWRRAEAEARDLAERFIDVVAGQPSDVDVVIGGGEATVTVRGEGVGGRNTEFALATAILLEQRGFDWAIGSLASDGQDGLIDAAGAIVDRHTVRRGNALGLDAAVFLDRNDSGTYFQRLGLLVRPGPTETNVNDVYVAVRLPGNRIE